MDKVKVFKTILDTFETDKMKKYCENMIDLIPDYIFIMPSSTSGKYHNKTQCQPHGQILHIIMLAKIMNYRLELDWNKKKFPNPIERDALRCGAIFHDAIKCGYNNSRHTVFDHPLLSGAWVRNTVVDNDIEPELKDYIAKLCESHSGQYNTSSRSSVVLPIPETEAEFFIHECDVLASRTDIDMIITNELDVFDEPANTESNIRLSTSIADYWMPFGKYKGELLIDVAKNDRKYLEWLNSQVITDALLKGYLAKILI